MTRALIVGLLAVLGCESKSKPAPDPEPAAEPARPATDARPVDVKDSSAAATGTLGAWLAAHPPDGKRVKAENIDKATRAELVELGKSLVDQGYRDRPMRLRWARALSPKAAAFSIGYQAESDKVSVYAVAVIEGGAAAVGSGASVRVPEHADGGTDFQADIDADNDGLDDPVVSYEVSQAGGGESTQGGIIVLGSRGSTLDIDTMSRDAEFEAGDDNYARSTDPVVLCWTKIGDTAALISASSTESDPVYEPGKKPSWDLRIYGADQRGVLGELEVSARVVKSGPMARLATKASTLAGETAFETPACAGPLIVPDLAGSFRQVTDLAIGPPAAGRVALGAPKAK